MLSIKIELKYDEALYNLLYVINDSFETKLEDGKMIIEIKAENSVKARQIINSLLRLLDTAERIEQVF